MPKRILEGDVVSDKMDKTITVLVERRYKHPVYKKYIKRTDRYAAHDEANSFQIGDRVQIQECTPLSKRKAWTVITQAPSRPAKTAPKKDVEVKEKAAEEKKADTKADAKKDVKKASTKKKAASKKKDEKK